MSALEQWTYEDIAIWIDVAERFGFWLTGGCCEQDRRDRELMWAAQRTRRRYGIEGGHRPMAWRFPDDSFGVDALRVLPRWPWP